MAAAELVEEVLKVGHLTNGSSQGSGQEMLLLRFQVPQGSVTPFAAINPEAADVALLLDEKIQSEQRVYVHPLVNSASLGMTPASLSDGLR